MLVSRLSSMRGSKAISSKQTVDRSKVERWNSEAGVAASHLYGKRKASTWIVDFFIPSAWTLALPDPEASMLAPTHARERARI